MSTADPPQITPEQLAEIAAAVAAILRQAAPPAVENELRLYTAEEAAPLVGKSAIWLKRQARSGAIPHCRVGRAYMFRAAHIRQLQDLNEVDPKTRRPRRATAKRPAA